MADTIVSDAPSWAELRAFIKENEERAEHARLKREAERTARYAAEEQARQKREAERVIRDAEWEKKQKALEKRLGIVEDHWSKLVEALLKNQLVKNMRKRGIFINYTMQNMRDDVEKKYEFDVVGVNGDTVIFVEVKTTLHCEDVTDFITQKLPNVKTWLKEYADKKIVGAVAYIHDKNKAAELAEKKGLFVILGVNDTIEIINDKDFIPKSW